MNLPKKILIADDEPDILEIIKYNLLAEGFEVFTAKNGIEAIDVAKHQLPDLIILDIMMPHKSGLDVCIALRQLPIFKNTLIIFLTALSDEANEIKGLETGADDYLTKPIRPKILISKVNALLRRISSNENETKVLKIGGLEIDREKFLINYNDKDIFLARKEFELLALLASKPGKVFLRAEILNSIWGSEVIVGDRTIDVHIRKIRQKLNLDCISTVKGVGYKFDV